jgi:polysaccharide pyruvyl transferase CsaB
VTAPRFLISGYYGFGNLGDEALLEAMVARLRARYPGCAIDVLSHDPAATSAHLDVDATPRADARAVRAAIGRADVVLSGGGGLMQNVTSLRSLLYYAGIVRAATRAKKQTMIFAQSIGPLDRWGRLVVRACCSGVAAATVRDERSRRLLTSIVPKVRVERTADPVFLLQPGSAPLDLRAEGLDGPGPLVVVSVRRWQGHDATVALLAAAVDRLAEVHGAQVAFLPLGGAPDADAATSVIRRARSAPVLLPDYPLHQAAQVLGRATLVIGMRLHALILAARAGVPFTALPYDPKVSALLEDLRYPLAPLFVPGARGTATDEMLGRLDEAWTRREELAAHLRGIMPEIERLAERNFDVLDDVVARKNS